MALEGRVAVITGATGGLGRVVAAQLAGQGLRLALVSTNQQKLEKLKAELGRADSNVLIHSADLSDAQSTLMTASVVMQAFGQVDILVHLVGGWVGGARLENAQPTDLDAMLRQHVWTTFHLVQAFAPHLRANGWGRIIAVSSPSAVRPAAKGSLYAAAKASQEALLLALSQELKDSGVTVNILQVRTIDTAHELDRQPTPANASWSTPEEISAAVVYLCSDEARQVNGARIPLYGSS